MDRLRCSARPCFPAFVAATLVVATLAGLLGGCAATRPRPEVLSIPAERYGEAFDAAVEVARHEGMPALLRDPRGGVIETEPEVAGSLLEPGRNDNHTFEQALENTVSYQRRRARFEFVPVGYRPLAEAETGPLAGPDLLADARPLTDLTRDGVAVELRVWVYVERAYRPGVRRSTWSRRLTTNTTIYAPGRGDRVSSELFWTPVSRDRESEWRLLEAVARRLDAPAP